MKYLLTFELRKHLSCSVNCYCSVPLVNSRPVDFTHWVVNIHPFIPGIVKQATLNHPVFKYKYRLTEIYRRRMQYNQLVVLPLLVTQGDQSLSYLSPAHPPWPQSGSLLLMVRPHDGSQPNHTIYKSYSLHGLPDRDGDILVLITCVVYQFLWYFLQTKPHLSSF